MVAQLTLRVQQNAVLTKENAEHTLDFLAVGIRQLDLFINRNTTVTSQTNLAEHVVVEDIINGNLEYIFDLGHSLENGQLVFVSARQTTNVFCGLLLHIKCMAHDCYCIGAEITTVLAKRRM